MANGTVDLSINRPPAKVLPFSAIAGDPLERAKQRALARKKAWLSAELRRRREIRAARDAGFIEGFAEAKKSRLFVLLCGVLMGTVSTCSVFLLAAAS